MTGKNDLKPVIHEGIQNVGKMETALVDILQKDSRSHLDRGVISLIGAGGKTSLMFALAKQLSRCGKKVLSTTTTKIFMPEKSDSPETIFADNFDDLLMQSTSCLERHAHFSAGKAHDRDMGKLIGFSDKIIDQLHAHKLFDWIIVEADGARGKSIKATDLYEPVVPETTTHLVLVSGLDIIGKPLDSDHVHRPHLFSKTSGLSQGAMIDEKAAACAISYEVKKASALCRPDVNIVFLNKADTSERKAAGEKISKLLQKEKYITSVVTAALKHDMHINRFF